MNKPLAPPLQARDQHTTTRKARPASTDQRAEEHEAAPRRPSAAERAFATGHRERLRGRFDRGETLADYELLELYLFRAVPRRDTKPIAKAMIARFGSLAAALSAPPDQLCAIDGVGERIVSDLGLVRALAERFAHEPLRERPTLGSTDEVVRYFRTALRGKDREEFHVLYLDRKNKVLHLDRAKLRLASEAAGVGTVNHTPVYPREVVRGALQHNASAIVLVHNHPSGDPSPSRADIVMTGKIVEAASALGIAVHDHLIIGANDAVSLRAEGLM